MINFVSRRDYRFEFGGLSVQSVKFLFDGLRFFFRLSDFFDYGKMFLYGKTSRKTFFVRIDTGGFCLFSLKKFFGGRYLFRGGFTEFARADKFVEARRVALYGEDFFFQSRQFFFVRRIRG